MAMRAKGRSAPRDATVLIHTGTHVTPESAFPLWHPALPEVFPPLTSLASR
jgi:hypothetical protein